MITSNPYMLRPLPIIARRDELPDVFTFTFEPEAGFQFLPGQFNMLYLHGVGEVPISICGDPGDPARLQHTIRAVGTVTRALQPLAAGDVLGVRGPYGQPWPIDELCGRDVVFIAGGLGLAPLRPAILRVLSRRAQYGAVTLLYGARTPSDMLYARELASWRGRFDCRVEVIVDRAGPDWFGPVGVVTKLIAATQLEPDDAVLMCGPEIMMRFAVHELERSGVPRQAIYLSLERSMKCAVGLCGHCQLAGQFVCTDGPVFRFDRVADAFFTRDL